MSIDRRMDKEVAVHMHSGNILPACLHAKSLQSCPTLCNPVDYSPPGSSVPGILQARILKWVAISLLRGSSDPGIKPVCPVLQADSLLSEPPGKPKYLFFPTKQVIVWIATKF